MALPRLKLTTGERDACQLLEMLDETRKKNTEDGKYIIAIKTPVLGVFMNQTKEFTEGAFDNIKQFNRLYEKQHEHSKEIALLQIIGCRGKLADNLKAFALTGAWSIVSQNYVTCSKKQHKIPIITTKENLEQLVWTRINIKKLMNHDSMDISAPEIQELINAYENFIVVSQEEYMHDNDNSHSYINDINKVLSWRELVKNPHKNHEKWEYFFTTSEKKNIDHLMDDIKSVIFLYRQMIEIQHRYKNANIDTDKLLANSSVLGKSSTFISREKELVLLNDVGEKTGDNISKERFENASNANLKKYNHEIVTTQIKNNNKHKHEDIPEDKMRFVKRVYKYSNFGSDSECSDGDQEYEDKILKELPDI